MNNIYNEWNLVTMLATVLLAVLSGVGASWLSNWLKLHWPSLSGEAIYWLSLVLLFVVGGLGGLLAAIVEGQLTPDNLNATAVVLYMLIGGVLSLVSGDRRYAYNKRKVGEGE